MPKVAILVDSEIGHLLSTFELVRGLSKQGYEIHYLGCEISREIVQRQGFGLTAVSNSKELLVHRQSVFLSSPFDGDLDYYLNLIKSYVQPDLILVLSLFCPEALLLKYFLKVPVILIRNHFSLLGRIQSCREIFRWRSRGDHNFNSKLLSAFTRVHLYESDLVNLAGRMIDVPEIILLPAELGLDHTACDDLTCCAGLMVNTEGKQDEASFPWGEIPAGRKLIYCSFGSQWRLESEVSLKFFRVLLEVIGKHPELFLILSMGQESSSPSFEQRTRCACCGLGFPK